MTEFLDIESLDMEARGVARRDGKVVFVHGALPGERVTATTTRVKPSYDVARVDRIVRESSQRVVPPCPNFGVCGGCAMQHLAPDAQVAIKQRVLEDGFSHIARLRPERMLPPMLGPTWGYRYRARLSVRHVPKKGGVLVGFRERSGSYVVDMKECLVLPAHVSAMLGPLRDLFGRMSAPNRMPQVEVCVGDDVVALVLRHMLPLTDDDFVQLRAFAAEYNVQWWLQSKGPETVQPLEPEHADTLAYTLPQFGLRMPYRPTDFTQVNHMVNRSLIARALSLLDVQSTDRVADMFCGLGNFTLPLATQAREVVGVEGASTLTDRALDAAARHGLSDRTSFSTLNLFTIDAQWLRSLGRFDRMLIDPPREGAHALVLAMAELSAAEQPDRIVYVSCAPGTLARDAGILVHEGGYRLSAAGVVNMFPHTGHVESIAVFERVPPGAERDAFEAARAHRHVEQAEAQAVALAEAEARAQARAKADAQANAQADAQADAQAEDGGQA
ncbi:MAG: 23S rRNA (uracil(1939)-C(5))-methyltransferase RlmD [Alcaligenaceae bacterium]|nr:MAG: 23S rRNA (uracil(1939)-C(5))-methyltransferase RlmD [Alcaligenaceae bacterium]